MFDSLAHKFSELLARFSGKNTVTQADMSSLLDEVQSVLIDADVPFGVAQQFIQEIKQQVIGQKLVAKLNPQEQLMKVMYDKMVLFLGGVAHQEAWSFQIPSITLVMGLQGSGKTTSIAKLAYYTMEQAKKRGKSRRILLASVDFYRPAAVDQLAILAESIGVDFYRSPEVNVLKAACDIYNYYQKNSYDCLILDTAGRLHIDNMLLDELQALDKLLKPKYKILVLDAMTGQESLQVAQAFEERVHFTHALLSKLDSQARGGAAFAFKYVLKKDILFVGTGEKSSDLELFRPQRVASRILGMGDMMTLVERAQEKIKADETERMNRSFKDGKMSLEDFSQQLDMVGRLGSFSSLMKYMPGIATTKISDSAIEQGEKDLKKFKAIVSSMTRKERLVPAILDKSRKERIARGAGVRVSDIQLLLERFEQTQQFVKIFKRMGRLNPFLK